MEALTLMSIYLWVAPIQLLHALYKGLRKGKTKAYSSNLKRYTILVIGYFLLWIIIGNEPVHSMEIAGEDISTYHLVVSPGMIALYYSYISLKRYPKHTARNLESC